MTTTRDRKFEDIVAQLKDPEDWSKTGPEEVMRVATNVTFRELLLQMRLWATDNSGFSPSIAISALTALHLDGMAHRDEHRFVTGR